MALLGLDGRVEQTNATYASGVPRDRGELVGIYCWDLVHAQDRDAVRSAIDLVATHAVPVVEGEVRDTSGEQWARVSVSRIDGPEGPRLLVQMVDVTEQRRATRLLHSQASTDVLTGLCNRAGLNQELQALLGKSRAGGERVAVIFCDLDLFKLVNDTHGHAAGDELLVHVARVLQGELRGGDIAARFGGDEFVVLHGDLACAATDWVIQSALTDAAQWPEHHGCGPFVSINISPEQLARADLTAIIDTHLRRTGIDADRVWIEVTEEALVAGSAQLSALRDLRSLGVHVALDDFGSGYAGLLALRDVPADIVKLDREFTRSLLTDSTTRAIVESVVALCARLGRTLVAEGLETAEDVAALHELGVELGQGWHLGRPSAWPRSEPAPVPRPPIDRRPA